MDEPSDGEIYAAYSRRFEDPTWRKKWIEFLTSAVEKSGVDLETEEHDAEGE